MAQVKDYVDRINTRFDEQSNDAAELHTAVDGVQADVTFLKETIAKLQNTNGQLTPEDQALLDQLEARVNTTSTNIKDAATKAKALDEATSVPPPEPPEDGGGDGEEGPAGEAINHGGTR